MLVREGIKHFSARNTTGLPCYADSGVLLFLR